MCEGGVRGLGGGRGGCESGGRRRGGWVLGLGLRVGAPGRWGGCSEGVKEEEGGSGGWARSVATSAQWLAWRRAYDGVMVGWWVFRCSERPVEVSWWESTLRMVRKG